MNLSHQFDQSILYQTLNPFIITTGPKKAFLDHSSTLDQSKPFYTIVENEFLFRKYFKVLIRILLAKIIEDPPFQNDPYELCL